MRKTALHSAKQPRPEPELEPDPDPGEAHFMASFQAWKSEMQFTDHMLILAQSPSFGMIGARQGSVHHRAL